MFGYVVGKFDFKWIDYIKLILTKIESKVNLFYVWIHSYKSELSNKFKCKNQF